jgi:predicted Zn-dependent protease
MRINLKVIFVLVVLFTLHSCATVPITGRKQLNVFPESQMVEMSVVQYSSFLSENTPLPPSNPQAQMVSRVGENISVAVEKYLKENGHAKILDDFQWEFNTVENPSINAWCMPGGKVVFYTGILPVCADESGVAVVMGHEVAHAVARHGNERMSQQMGVQAAGMTLDAYLQTNPTQANDLFMQSFGFGAGVGMLAFSRSHETEADKMGLVFMAMAGYDPHRAPEFWKEMAKMGGEKPPELLSTHPSDDRRVADLELFMPEAMKYYKQ